MSLTIEKMKVRRALHDVGREAVYSVIQAHGGSVERETLQAELGEFFRPEIATTFVTNMLDNLVLSQMDGVVARNRHL